MTDIRRGWFHLASGAGIGRVFGFGSNLLLSRWLGPTELGLFNLLTTTVQTSDTLVRCGGDYALNFELGGDLESTQTANGVQLARGLAQICSLMTGCVCIGVLIWVWCAQGLLPISFASSYRITLTSLLLLMIACEGTCASAWEVLLVSHRTGPLALRQGLFVPLRLLLAAGGSLLGGVLGAMLGWSFIAVVQCFWLKSVLGNLWKPLRIWPLLWSSLSTLLSRGFPFYASNLLAAIVFYPLLLRVAAGTGLAEIGYLRVGQILQQLFAFLPATLVPVLFLRLRGEASFAGQVSVMEKPLRIIWFLLIEVVLLYCMIDQSLIAFLFGTGFASALLPTRLLLITSLFECLAQLVVQPLLAAGQTRIYGFWQNGAAISAAFLGWLWIPTSGLAAYLIVRLLYVTFPLIGFGLPVVKHLNHPSKILPLAVASIILMSCVLYQISTDYLVSWMPSVFLFLFMVIVILQRRDLASLQLLLRFRA